MERSRPTRRLEPLSCRYNNPFQTPLLAPRSGGLGYCFQRRRASLHPLVLLTRSRPPFSRRDRGSGVETYLRWRKQANTETITQTPDLGARRGVVYNPGPRARREKGGLERARLRWKEAGLHGDCDPDPQTRRETGGLAAREGVKKRARLRRKEAGLHGDYNPDPRSRREKGGLERVSGTRGCE